MCRSAYNLEYRAKKGDAVRSIEASYRDAHRPELRARDKQRVRDLSRVRESNRMTIRVRRWYTAIYHSALTSARKYKLEIDIDAAFVLALYEKQGGRCYWLGIPIIPSLLTRDPQRPSIDRLDGGRGYTRDNVVLTSQFANMGRNCTTVENFMAFLKRNGLRPT